jgi:hypothetical protein
MIHGDGSGLTNLSMPAGNLTGTIANGQIGFEAVTNSKLGEASVGNLKIANGAVDSSKITNGTILNEDIANATITDAKLAPITTANKVANSATSGVSTNMPSTLVLRNGNGGFSAATITASLAGNATTATTAGNVTGIVGIANGGTNSATKNFVDLINAQTIGGNKTFTNTVSCLTLSITSDRNAKERFMPVNAREVLDKVARLPISEWQYKTQADARHIGPMAQDFHAAFSVGSDEKHIATVDADGVALAAIQGLNQKLEEEAHEKDGRIEQLEKSVEELKNLVKELAGQRNGGAK